MQSKSCVNPLVNPMLKQIKQLKEITKGIGDWPGLEPAVINK